MNPFSRDTDDGSDASGGGASPSIEDLISAYRKASEHEERPASPNVERSVPRTPDDESSVQEVPESQSPQSPTETLNETIAAYRKTKRRPGGPEDREAGQPRQARREEETEQQVALSFSALFGSSSGEEPDQASDVEEGSDEGVSDSFEDFGPAFQKAFSERRRITPENFADIFAGQEENEDESDDSEIEEEEEKSDPAEETFADREEIEEEEVTEEDIPSGSEEEGLPEEEEPIERSGDTLPASEKLEISTSDPDSTAASPSPSVRDVEERGATDFPTRPDDSFLWVSAQPVDDPAVVSIDRLGASRAKAADAFLLQGGGREPYDLLARIRGHSEMDVYLKPVFWRHAEGQRSRVAEHVDGEWTSQNERDAASTLRGQAATINQRIDDLIGVSGQESGGVELRVLRFMATRNHEFTPRRTVENSDGFIYPKLTPLFERESRSGGDELAQILSMLEERRLLTGEFVMRQHACRNCGSAFLNFEEMCPNCGSTSIDADDLVHHFRCAFTGALSEYKKEQGKLVCPKCDRQLKQIGVDYDKPSVVHTCRRCQEEFQDPEVQTTCYQCEHSNAPERQVERQIKEYEITALGEETAIHGLSDSLLSILERESRVLDYATFQLIVESEAARIERYQRSTSCLLLVRVAGLKRLRMELGERSQEVIEEIATAFDNTLRSSDYLSARDESLYMFLLTETDQSGARRAGERLEENIEGVLKQNLDRPPTLDIAVQPVRPDVDLDDLAEQFLSLRSRDPAVAAQG